MVGAIYVLEQAKEAGIFSIDDRATVQFSFSHLYTALSRKPYRDYLGIESTWASFDPKPDPIPTERLDRLAEILIWLYGSRQDHIDPVVRSQNPDLKRLGDVLLNEKALLLLKDSATLSEAYEIAKPVGQLLSSALVRALRNLREAFNGLQGFDGKDESLVDIAGDVSKQAQAIHSHLQNVLRENLNDSD